MAHMGFWARWNIFFGSPSMVDITNIHQSNIPKSLWSSRSSLRMFVAYDLHTHSLALLNWTSIETSNNFAALRTNTSAVSSYFWRRCFRFGVRKTLGGLSGLDGRRFLGWSWWTPDIRIVGYRGRSYNIKTLHVWHPKILNVIHVVACACHICCSWRLSKLETYRGHHGVLYVSIVIKKVWCAYNFDRSLVTLSPDILSIMIFCLSFFVYITYRSPWILQPWRCVS